MMWQVPGGWSIAGYLAGYLMVGIVAVGCASHPPTIETLTPSTGTAPTVLALIEEGNRLFAQGRWGEARARYEEALAAQPTLAEGHYNLALTLERLGDGSEARRHYIEAANLAPGHKIIWNSPPLRQHGNVTPRSGSGSGPIFMPAFGQ